MNVTLFLDWLRFVLYLLTALMVSFHGVGLSRPARITVWWMSTYIAGLGAVLLARNGYLPISRDALTNYVMTPALIVLLIMLWWSLWAQRKAR